MGEPRMGLYYDAMTRDMGGKLNGYFQSLQHRYGDPRVYAEQRNEMQQQQAAVMHARATTVSEALKEAYSKKSQQNRDTHKTRLSKRRVGRTASSRPAPETAADQSQTAPPSPQPKTAAVRFDPSAS